jgi:hypothetical protein
VVTKTLAPFTQNTGRSCSTKKTGRCCSISNPYMLAEIFVLRNTFYSLATVASDLLWPSMRNTLLKTKA